MKLSVFYENQEAYSKEFLKALLKRLIQWSYLVGLAGLVFSFLFYRDGRILAAGSLVTAGLISLAVALFVLPLTLKEYKDQVKATAGEEDKVLVRFFEDYLEIHQGQSHLRIDYKNIERIFTSQNLYIFQMGKNSGFYLPKDALTPEKIQDFDALMEGPFKGLPRKERGFFSNK